MNKRKLYHMVIFPRDPKMNATATVWDLISFEIGLCMLRSSVQLQMHSDITVRLPPRQTMIMVFHAIFWSWTLLFVLWYCEFISSPGSFCQTSFDKNSWRRPRNQEWSSQSRKYYVIRLFSPIALQTLNFSVLVLMSVMGKLEQLASRDIGP